MNKSLLFVWQAGDAVTADVEIALIVIVYRHLIASHRVVATITYR